MYLIITNSTYITDFYSNVGNNLQIMIVNYIELNGNNEITIDTLNSLKQCFQFIEKTKKTLNITPIKIIEF